MGITSKTFATQWEATDHALACGMTVTNEHRWPWQHIAVCSSERYKLVTHLIYRYKWIAV